MGLWFRCRRCLTAESVQGTSLSLQSVHNIHGCDGLPLGVLGVCDGIPDDVLKENLEYSTGLFVDQTRDTFDSTSTGQTTDSGLGDTLDVITQHLPVPLGTSLSESLSSFTSSRHVYRQLAVTEMTRTSLCRYIYRYRGLE